MIFQGIRTSIAKKPLIFVIFQGGGPDNPVPPSRFAHAGYTITPVFLEFCIVQALIYEAYLVDEMANLVDSSHAREIDGPCREKTCLPCLRQDKPQSSLSN